MRAALGFILTIAVLSNGCLANIGRHFAIAFPPTRNNANTGSCVIYVHAYTNSIAAQGLTVTTFESSDIYTLYPNNTLVLNFAPNDFRTTSGLQFKAIYLESTVDISVIVSNTFDSSYMDTLLALPRYEGQNKYMILNYPSTSAESTCVQGSTVSFVQICAFEPATRVNIWDSPGGQLVANFTMSQGQSYILRSQKNIADPPTITKDYTGHYLESVGNKPISVTVGNPCLDIARQYPSAPAWASLPPIETAGTTYVSHYIQYPAASLNSYQLRVISLESQNDIELRYTEQTIVLDNGAFADFEISRNQDTEMIVCSKKCLVAQLSQNHNTTAIFMTILPEYTSLADDVLFTIPNHNRTGVMSYLSIIYNTSEPETSRLMLDNQDLSQESTWTIHPYGYSFLTLDFDRTPEVVHSLHSDDPAKTFSLLVHGQGSNGAGYGFMAAAKLVTGSVVEPNVTVPSYVFDYELSLEGNFYSSDGSSFTPECSLRYSSAMQSEADDSVARVNARIGVDICTTLTIDDVSVESVTAPLTTSGSTGSTILDYFLMAKVGGNVPKIVEACVSEVSLYLRSHDNWGSPVLPPPSGCPGAVFTTPYFNQTASHWVCPQAEVHDVLKKVDVLVYYITHVGNFATETGESISAGCLADYMSAFDANTQAQVQNINNMLMSNELCAGAQTPISLIMLDSLLSSTGNEGLSLQEYQLDYTEEADGTELYVCASEISAYMQEHANWNQPILPPQTGCPDLLFSPEQFDEYQNGWECVNV